VALPWTLPLTPLAVLLLRSADLLFFFFPERFVFRFALAFVHLPPKPQLSQIFAACDACPASSERRRDVGFSNIEGRQLRVLPPSLSSSWGDFFFLLAGVLPGYADPPPRIFSTERFSIVKSVSSPSLNFSILILSSFAVHSSRRFSWCPDLSVPATMEGRFVYPFCPPRQGSLVQISRFPAARLPFLFSFFSYHLCKTKDFLLSRAVLFPRPRCEASLFSPLGVFLFQVIL